MARRYGNASHPKLGISAQALVTVYEAGTLTLASITDGSGSPLNPLTTSADGDYIYDAAEGCYDELIVATSWSLTIRNVSIRSCGVLSQNSLYLNNTLQASTQQALGSNSMYNYDNTDPFSISLWLKFDSNTSNEICILGKSDYGTTPFGWNLAYVPSSESLVFSLANGQTTNYIAVSWDILPTSDGWNYFVITYSGSSDAAGFTLYKNAVDEVANKSVARDDLTSTTVNSNAFSIGVGPAGVGVVAPDSHWWGHMYDVVFVDKELSQAEVDEGISGSSPVIIQDVSWYPVGAGLNGGHYSFSLGSDDMTGGTGTIGDVTGNGNTLTPSGSPAMTNAVNKTTDIP